MTREEINLLKADVSARLQYGVRFAVGGNYLIDVKFYTITGISDMEEMFHYGCDSYDWWNIDNGKPVLYSFVDITNEIVLRGRSFVPMDFLKDIINLDGYHGQYTTWKVVDSHIEFSIWGEWVADFDYRFNVLKYKPNYSVHITFQIALQIMDKLNEWMIDYRDLIRNGLAINARSLIKNPYVG